MWSNLCATDRCFRFLSGWERACEDLLAGLRSHLSEVKRKDKCTWGSGEQEGELFWTCQVLSEKNPLSCEYEHFQYLEKPNWNPGNWSETLHSFLFDIIMTCKCVWCPSEKRTEKWNQRSEKQFHPVCNLLVGHRVCLGRAKYSTLLWSNCFCSSSELYCVSVQECFTDVFSCVKYSLWCHSFPEYNFLHIKYCFALNKCWK